MHDISVVKTIKIPPLSQPLSVCQLIEESSFDLKFGLDEFSDEDLPVGNWRLDQPIQAGLTLGHLNGRKPTVEMPKG